MTKKIAYAAVAAVVLGSLYFAWEEHQRADAALDRAEATAESKREALEDLYQWYRPYIRRWQDSARRASERKNEALARLDSAEATFDTRMEALLSSAPPAQRPQLLALDSAHTEAMDECLLALKACEAETTALAKQLSATRDSLLPMERRAREAERALAEQATDIARPGIITRALNNVEEIGAGIVIGVGVTCALAC